MEKNENSSKNLQVEQEDPHKNTNNMETSCGMQTGDFLEKIILMNKISSEAEKKDLEEISETARKNFIRKISVMTNIDLNGELTVEELDKKMQDVSIKPVNLLTEKEKDLHILEQIGLNCIFTEGNDSAENLEIRKQKYKEFHDKIIVGNQKWIENKKNEDEAFFEKLTKPQKPKYLVIACSDSRVVVNEFTATEPGDVFTHRNIGNLVISTDFNCQSVLQFAIDYLKVEHILVIGHTDCGAVRAALSYDHHGLIDHWLKNIREVAEKHGNEFEKINDENHEKIVKKLIELNIKEQCLNLCKSPIIQGAWARGQDLYIHGYVFEMDSGLLKDLEVVQKDWSNIQDIYKYYFRK